MPITKDPEGIESAALFELANFKDQEVVEVGCGEGRLTWRYAEKVREVAALDPEPQKIAAAQANIPPSLKGKISFLNTTLEDFAESAGERKFDLALFAWSL